MYKALAVSRDWLAVSARGQCRGSLNTKPTPYLLYSQSFSWSVVVVLLIRL